jgi:ketosteroid isomerase-like protein
MRWRQITAALALLLIGPVCGQAQSDAKVATEADIRAADETFWKAYNACDLDGMAPFLTDDVEFYHDKTGLTRTRKAVIDSLRKGVCANPAMHIRREAIVGTVSYHRLADAGAILLGQHRFYVNGQGKPERLDGQANFTHIWV